jgi:hypothetical protein
MIPFNTKKEIRFRKLKRVLALVLVVGIIGLTHDIIITNFLAYRICKADPNPKTFIKQTVEFPESIYWEDNIYPGFDEKDRLLMIRNYLDGVHLKKMALNSPDGTIYLYSASEQDWQTSKQIKARKIAGNYYDTLQAEAAAIAERGEKISRKDLAGFRYSVVVNMVQLTSFQKRYVYSDEVAITDNQTGEIIGFNRRLMARWYFLLPDFEVGGRYYYPDAKCGENDIYGFDEQIFSSYSDVQWQPAHIGVNRELNEILK